ncbi:APC family permease [Pseudogracilibacillus auburnensis]|uniref:Amino acid/polyamine/organocation transporter (APC superfamily) n=1 Tax=Pseudogracilibacillus auburnensis TaxID=1494959 RepID=A0A2V3W8E9_9BACI|nr:APC family permease [Pseudogracilibacillus auburnensis]PXW90637.1 amino acid/polyamine/organocation transporter (APC superfamily) [Pseudogracilibacillus auburnensis]
MEDVKLVKILKNKDVLTLAFGAMIGWGWVVTAGLWITEAGSLGAILAFVIGGILVVLIGLTYAELASSLPLAGGELIYSFKAMGRVASYVTTWALILGYVSVVAFEAVALPTVFEYLIPDYSVGYLYTIADWEVTATWAGVGILGSILITWINYRGIKFSTAIMFILTLLIVIAGVLLITGSGVSGSSANMQPLFENGTAGILTVIIMTPFMFVGFDVIPQAAEEINLPQKRIGQLLIFSVILAVIWYVSIIFGVSRILTPEEISASNLVTADAMAKAFGNSKMMGNILVLGGIGGILTSWIGFYIGGSRAIYALARAGMLPKALGDLHPTYKTPYKAILLIGMLSAIAPLFGRPALVWLVDAGGFGLVIAWFMVAVSFLILRKKEPKMVRPFQLKGGPVIGWIAIVMAIGVGILYMPGMPSALIWPYEWIIVIIWMMIGVVFYQVSIRKRSAIKTEDHLNNEINRVIKYK